MKRKIGFEEARELVASYIKEGPCEDVSLETASGRICAREICALVSCPSVDASLKDGYALLPEDVKGAGPDRPVTLTVTGHETAGAAIGEKKLSRGEAIRVTSGAALPAGASVLAEEFTRREGDVLYCFNDAEPGRNVLPRGLDAREGEVIVSSGERLTPPLLGLLAAAGLSSVPVYLLPRVAVIATGDEIVAPGQPLPDGRLYASNLTELGAWLASQNCETRFAIAGDSREDIRDAVRGYLEHADAIVTSGGAWKSERDLIIDVFEELGWKGIFHRVRMGPGKAIAFGLLNDKPVFCLPGGPPSNEMAFLQLALPGIMKMGGSQGGLFETRRARLTETLRGQGDWTQFFGATLNRQGEELIVEPMKEASRLRSMARRDGIIMIPEGVEELREGSVVEVQVV